MKRPSRRTVAAVQAAYYLPTAIAPFVSRRAFESVTGPKADWWLVLTVGTQVGAIGASLALAAREHPGPQTAVLGGAAAAGLGLIDVVYVSRGRIRWTYLLDAAVELPLAMAWLAARG